MRRVLLLLFTAAIVTAVAVAAVLVTLPEAERDATAQRPPTLASLDTRDTVVDREPFCAALSTGRVADLLGTSGYRTAHYGDGETARLAPGVRDVSHEFGCRFRTGARELSAWVFVPPVDRSTARRLARSARSRQGCTPLPDAERFGAPTVAVRCRSEQHRTVTYAGAFGDAWLACAARAPRAEPRRRLVRRTEDWCVQVLRAAGD